MDNKIKGINMKINLKHFKRDEVLLAFYNAAKEILDNEAARNEKNYQSPFPKITLTDAVARLNEPPEAINPFAKGLNVDIIHFHKLYLNLKFRYSEDKESFVDTQKFDEKYGELVTSKVVAKLRQGKIAEFTTKRQNLQQTLGNLHSTMDSVEEPKSKKMWGELLNVAYLPDLWKKTIEILDKMSNYFGLSESQSANVPLSQKIDYETLLPKERLEKLQEEANKLEKRSSQNVDASIFQDNKIRLQQIAIINLQIDAISEILAELRREGGNDQEFLTGLERYNNDSFAHAMEKVALSEQERLIRKVNYIKTLSEIERKEMGVEHDEIIAPTQIERYSQMKAAYQQNEENLYKYKGWLEQQAKEICGGIKNVLPKPTAPDINSLIEPIKRFELNI